MFNRIRDRAFIAAVRRVREENQDNIAGYRIGVLLKKYALPSSMKQRGYGAAPQLEDVPAKDRPAFLAELGVPVAKPFGHFWPRRRDAPASAPPARQPARTEAPDLPHEAPDRPSSRRQSIGIAATATLGALAASLRFHARPKVAVGHLSLLGPWLIMSGLWIVGVVYGESLDGLLLQEWGEVLTTALVPTILPPLLLAGYVALVADPISCRRPR